MRPPVPEELKAPIRRLASENNWRARKIHAELKKLGFTIGLATVSRYLPKRAPDFGKQQRWVIDHVIALNEDHRRRLLRDYVTYYNAELVHTVLGDSPNGRPIEARPSTDAKVAGLPRVGRLHHRCPWKTAA